jgi:hypothetical protein
VIQIARFGEEIWFIALVKNQNKEGILTSGAGDEKTISY